MNVVSPEEAAKYYNTLPKKRTGSGVLIFNEQDELLIVKPTYLEQWLCPGGGIEDGEAPLAAAIRECQEEIGITFDELWPAYINYREPQPDGQQDMLQFMFTTKPVGNDFLGTIKLQDGEIEDAKFVPVNKLPNFFSAVRAKTVMSYFAHRHNKDVIYMENGEVIN